MNVSISHFFLMSKPEPYRVHDILGFHHDLPSAAMNLVVVLLH